MLKCNQFEIRETRNEQMFFLGCIDKKCDKIWLSICERGRIFKKQKVNNGEPKA